MTSGTWRVCALAAATLLGSGLANSAALAGPDRPDDHLSAAAAGPGAIQIVFVDGTSVRLGPQSIAHAAGRERRGDFGPVLEEGIVRVASGRLRRLPVLLSGQSANAHASLAVHAAMRGDSESARSALGRAKADVAGTTARHGPGWTSVTRAHVTLAEAQLLDLDGRYGEAEAVYRAGLDAIADNSDAPQNGSASLGVADARVLLSAELSRNLARNQEAQGRTAEAQLADRWSLRTYVARFGHAPATATSGLKGDTAGGMTQVAVNHIPGSAVVGQILLTGVLIVTAIEPDDVEDNVKDARGEPGGTTRSPGPLVDDSNVREPSGTAGGTLRSANRPANGSGGNGPSRDASGEPGGTSRSAEGSGGNTRDASGEPGGTSRSAEGSGGNTRDASGEPGGTSRSAEGSGGGTRDASGEAGGTSRSAEGSGGNTRDASGEAGGTSRSGG